LRARVDTFVTWSIRPPAAGRVDVKITIERRDAEPNTGAPLGSWPDDQLGAALIIRGLSGPSRAVFLPDDQLRTTPTDRPGPDGPVVALMAA
jgi:hypothetical protein